MGLAKTLEPKQKAKCIPMKSELSHLVLDRQRNKNRNRQEAVVEDYRNNRNPARIPCRHWQSESCHL